MINDTKFEYILEYRRGKYFGIYTYAIFGDQNIDKINNQFIEMFVRILIIVI